MKIIPFGKYKGQPIEVLTQDEAYLDWLLSQDWFRNRYQNLYTIIINNFQSPSETPEHNAMQIKFLNSDYCEKFLALFFGEERLRNGIFSYGEVLPATMEVNGMDIAFDYCMWKKDGTGKERYCRLYIEAKTTLGDNYPAVLRQITSSSAHRQFENGKYREEFDGLQFALFIGQFSGSIEIDMLIKYFKSSRIGVLFERDVDLAICEWSESIQNFEIKYHSPNKSLYGIQGEMDLITKDN